MPTPTTRRRERLCESPYVRFRKNGRFQARLWLGGLWGSVNLGLYGSEEAAAAASRAVLRELRGDTVIDPLTVWRATRAAIDRGAVRADVLPKYVVRRGGALFARLSGGLRGPYPTEVQAVLAAIDERVQMANRVRSGGPVDG